MKTLNTVPLERTQDFEWVDYSTLRQFMKCPRAYWWSSKMHVKKESDALIFGSAIHNALAEWFRNYKIDNALQAFIAEAKKIVNEDPKRNLSVGLDILDHYIGYWKDEQYTTVETDVPFAIELDTISNRPFLYVGKIDRILKSPMLGEGFMEHKTSSIMGERWADRINPNLQMEGYGAAASILTGQPMFGVLDVIHVHEKRQSRKFLRIIKSKQDVENWAEDVSWWMEQIRFFNGIGFHPKATEHCVPLKGMTCEYLTLCNLYPNPYNKDIQIPGDYKIEPWHPFEALKKKENV